MNKEKLLKIIDNKIKELDDKAFKHCFKKGKMCKECWEKKVPLLEVREECVLLGETVHE